MKRFLFFTIAALLFVGCQKPYVRPEIQTEESAEGTEIRYGLTNCVIAYNKTSVEINAKAYPASEKNFTTMPAKTESATAPKADSVGLVWRDSGLTLGSMSLADGKITVADISGYGNAVVAIFNQGKMLWSFHIWKPRVNPDSTVHYSALGADVMVLNLGAEDIWYGNTRTNSRTPANRMAGLFYQFGRKDPLGRPKLNPLSGYQDALNADKVKIDWDADVASTVEATADAKAAWIEAHAAEYEDPDTLEAYAQEYVNKNSGTIIRDWSMQHPTTLIYPAASYSTFNMTGGETQWKAADGIYKGNDVIRKYWYELKNAYDPCPEGYMLPPMKLYRGFISASTYIYDDDGDGGSNYSVKTYEGINADSKTKPAMETYCGYNFLYYGALDSSKTTFYPACGYRGAYSVKGALTDVGKRGRYHGYTTTTSYIRIFYFTAAELSAQYGYNPSSTANQVRCIKEMTFTEDEGD